MPGVSGDPYPLCYPNIALKNAQENQLKIVVKGNKTDKGKQDR